MRRLRITRYSCGGSMCGACASIQDGQAFRPRDHSVVDMCEQDVRTIEQCEVVQFDNGFALVAENTHTAIKARRHVQREVRERLRLGSGPTGTAVVRPAHRATVNDEGLPTWRERAVSMWRLKFLTGESGKL